MENFGQEKARVYLAKGSEGIINKVFDLTSQTSRSDTIYWGWFVVGGAFLILSMSYGGRYCFGVFVKPMFAEYQWSMSIISLAASINLFMYAVGGILTGWLLDKIAPKWIMTIGALVTALGFFLTAFCQSPLQLYISYGILCGIGSAGVGNVVSCASVAKWFVKKKGIAVGITTMGIGVGTVIFTPIAGYIVEKYGWRSGYVTLGVVLCVGGVFISQILMGRSEPEAHGLLLDGQKHDVRACQASSPKSETKHGLIIPVMRDFRFWVIAVSNAIVVMGVMLLFVHQVPYAINNNIGKIAAASSLGLLGVASILGRFFFGWLSDKVRDAKYCAVLGYLVMISGMFVLLGVDSGRTLSVYALILGFGYGSIAPMMPVLLADRFGRRILGTIYGILMFFVAGIGGGLGPVIGGVIYDEMGSYTYAWYMIIGLMGAASMLMMTLKKGLKYS